MPRRSERIPSPTFAAFSTNPSASIASDVARRQRALERGEIVERDLAAAGQERPEALAEDLFAVQRQRSHREAMEAVIAVDEARAPRVVARELDRGLDHLGARVGEEHLVEPAGCSREQTLGE